MSVTFTVPSPPRQTVPCRWCAEERAKGEVRENGHGGCCDPWCPGTTNESLAPEANFSQINAAALLRLLGLKCDEAGDLYGEIPVTELRQRLLVARNVDRSGYTFEGYSLPGGQAGTRVVRDEKTGLSRIERMGCPVIAGGCSDEQIERRLGQLDTLAKWAQANGFVAITWA